VLTRDAILAAELPANPVVEVPLWGGRIAVRLLTVEEALRWSDASLRGRAPGAAMLVRLAAVTEAGEPLFADEDLPWLESRPAAVLNPIMQAALAHNGYTRPAAEDAAGN
jgi:hypothetical protein